ncbi:MAG: hypothetical protein KKD17_06570 [Nanoarchaeota archaeon]|nr:hypothetical protein [Nanoarchaeota archaeon]
MPVSNEDIMKKLDRMEELIKKIYEQEETEIAEEKKIEQQEDRELKELDETVNLEFNNIEDWRKYIWDSCPFKVEKTEGGELDFFCKKQNGPCKFEGCPLNKKIDSQ